MGENVVVQRLSRVVALIAHPAGLRACEHVMAVHEAGEPLALCGVHPEIGLMCERCAVAHGGASHGRAFGCDYCSSDLDPDAMGSLFTDELVPAVRIRPAGVAASDEDPLVLMMVRLLVMGTPLCCLDPVCVMFRDFDVEDVTSGVA